MVAGTSPRERDLGRYELLLELARGGMAELFLGRLHGAGGFAKLVAIKRILPHLAEDRQFTQMFLDEGRIAARLSHQNICQVFELGEDAGQLFLVMEYLEGVSLAELIAASPGHRPDPRIVAAVLAQGAEGLHYAHTLRDYTGAVTPVVHRDVSPQNLFVTVDGICKLLDFGVSKVTTDPSRTKSGVIKGKLPYMPPEQIHGDEVDARADVFALGVCAWEALAGARLFDRPSDYLTWQAITEEPVPLLAAAWPACPPAVAAVVHRALGRTPAERQPSAQVFADELRGALGFASPAEIAAAVRATCADALAARAQQVAAAIAGGPVTTLPGAAAPTTAAATLDLRTQPASASIELRERSAVVERPTVPSRPAAVPAHRDTPTAVSSPSSVLASASATYADEPPVPPRTSRMGAIAIGIVVLAVAFAATIAITIVVVRGGKPAPPDAAVVVAPDAAADDYGLEGLDRGLRQLDRLKDLRKDLEGLRDTIHGIAPTSRHPDDLGRLQLTSDQQATVFEGEVELGTTPVDIRLPEGEHTLRVVYADGSTRTMTIEIVAGKTRSDKL